jgi:hypothetical protein
MSQHVFKESHMRIDEVRREMKALGVFADSDLSLLTQEIVDKGLQEAVALPKGVYPEGAAPFRTTWTGNNFRIVSGVWYWDDSPGNQCGRTRTWSYRPVPGASYRPVSTCSQGYSWYEMQIP